MDNNKKQIIMLIFAVLVMIVFLVVFNFFIFDRKSIFNDKQIEFYDRKYNSLSRMKIDIFERKELKYFKNIQFFNIPNNKINTQQNINIFQGE